MLDSRFWSCQIRQSRSIMQWCAQKIGSYAASGISAMVPPTQTWTRLWMSSSRFEKSRKLGAVRTSWISAAVGKSAGDPGCREVATGDSPSARAACSRASGGMRAPASGLAAPSTCATAYESGVPAACAWSDVQSHHGRDTVETWSCSASSKTYR